MKRPLEDVLNVANERRSTDVKRVYLTKAQRQKLALQNRQQQDVDNQCCAEQLLQDQSSSSSRHGSSCDRDRDIERRNHKREREEESETRDRREREKGKEVELIKEQIKPSEKFQHNALYQNPPEPHQLFGRGFRAGMDHSEQKKLAAKIKVDLHRKSCEEIAKRTRLDKNGSVEIDGYVIPVRHHWTQRRLEEMTSIDWRIFNVEFNISYKGSIFPNPMRNWEESKLSSELLRAVERAGYEDPTPIQMAAIPLGLLQRDFIGVAETGSGKTAAFVLPMLDYIARLPPITEENEAEGPYAVVMAPTCEVVQQIEEETVKLAHYLGINKIVSIVGGQSIEEQGSKLRQGCEIVIATPGGLLDCLQRRYVVLNQCNYVVVAEADQMIDMGFEPQVVGVLEAMPSSNMEIENEEEELDLFGSTYMFSATMPPAVEQFANKYLRKPVLVTIGLPSLATKSITQHVIMMEESEKMSKLLNYLNELGENTAIVFVNTKKTADALAQILDTAGFRVTTLHGGITKEQREIRLEYFRTKRCNVMVATNLGGCRIDIPDIAQVINFDMPGDIETYTLRIHRIGRTRKNGAWKTGVATTFLTLSDSDIFYDLKQMLLKSDSPIPRELEDMKPQSSIHG